MKTLFVEALVVLAVLAGVGLLWRLLSTRHLLPCPAWAIALLENPYFQAVAGAELLLNRAGVEAGMQVVDVGCGPGRLTIPAARRVATGGRVVALDVQPKMLEKLEERLKLAKVSNVETLLGGAGEGRLPAAAFDRALLVTVLGEIPDPVRALREIASSLRPGGVLSVTEVLPDPHYQSRRKVRNLATEAGLIPGSQFGNWIAFTLNFVKPGPAETV